MSHTVRITTGARLHFGLLDIAAPFGGCGVMIDTPRTVVEVEKSSTFAFVQTGGTVDHRNRATAIARRIADHLTLGQSLPGVSVHVVQSAPAHTGLGSGTQLSLAIAEAILRVISANPSESSLDDPKQSQQRDVWLSSADRGRRSAVGTYGYLHGGFIAEGVRRGLAAGVAWNEKPDVLDSLNPVDTRLDLPRDWRVSILLPAETPSSAIETVSGEQEQARFSSLPPVAEERRESLACLLSGELIPAIEQRDFGAFCTAVTRYNYASGELFASVQGGAYNGEATTRLINHLVGCGFTGVGQSSWGPGVFVWHADEAAAKDFEQSWQDSMFRVMTSQPRTAGRQAELF